MTHGREFLLLSLLTVACSHAAQKKDVVWPLPPETPRIKFVSSFRAEEDLDDSGFKRFSRAVLGTGSGLALSQPMGIALTENGERLYIADARGGQLVVADFKTRKLSRFTPEQGGFSGPFNVAVDAQENIYVSDPPSKSVSAYKKTGELLWSVTGDLERPTGLALDQARETLYVADTSRVMYETHRVFAYDLKGHRIRQIGQERGSDAGEFNFPLYLTVDKEGNLFVGDTMNFRIQEFDKEGKFLRMYGEHGDSPGTFSRMKGLAVDSYGNLYAVDGQHAVVQIFNKEFQPLMFFGGYAPMIEYFDIPSCIAIDQKTNRIFVCNEQLARVNVYDLVNTGASDSFDATVPPEGGPGNAGVTAPVTPSVPPLRPGDPAPKN